MFYYKTNFQICEKPPHWTLVKPAWINSAQITVWICEKKLSSLGYFSSLSRQFKTLFQMWETLIYFSLNKEC